MLKDLFRISTIQELIDYEKTVNISHYVLQYKMNFTDPNADNIILNYSTIYDRYFDYIQNISPLITLSDEEYVDYKFQPKKLCLYIYQNTELWSLVLRLNGLASVLDFNAKQLYLPIKQIFDILNEIVILEKDEIIQNKIDNGLK